MMTPPANSLRFLLCFLSFFLVVMAGEILAAVHPEEVPASPTASPTASPKVEWPEVVGLTAEAAETKIKEDMPTVNIQVIPPDTFVTMDFQTGRVRIHTDTLGKVLKAPRIG